MLTSNNNQQQRPPLPPPPTNLKEEPYKYSLTGNYRDFRDYSHTEDGHWNDVPNHVLRPRKDQIETNESVDINHVISILKEILSQCTLNIRPSQKRMLEDTQKRMDILIERLTNQQLSQSVLIQLNHLIQALQQKDYTTANKIHVDLMQTDYETEGRWLLGMKRLIDLLQAQ